MSTKTVLTSFVKQVVATIQGDDAEAKAQKIFRKADSAFRTQIAALEGETISLEDNVEAAKERLQAALTNNGNVELDRNSYIDDVLRAQNAIIEAEEALEEHLAKIAFLKEQYENIQK